MIRKPSNFVEYCLAGEALLEDIYRFIDEWHEADTDDELPTYLGMSDDEYALWLEKPEALPFILFAHQSHTPLREAIQAADHVRMAARAPGRANAKAVLEWLRQTNRI
jgi:hypothetical protein